MVLRSGGGSFDTTEILARPTRDLLGVSEAAARTLADLGIESVFDLGASHLFAAARAVLEFSRAGGAAPRLGPVPGDLLNDGRAAATAAEDLGDLPVTGLRPLTEDQGRALQESLDIATIADLANWPPHREARRLLVESAGATADPEDLQAEELRPRFGQFPTERVYYSTLVLMEVLGSSGELEELAGPISLDPAVDQPGGLDRIAVGALLSFEQSWFAQGVTLGHMLHSLSLAPGEATRIAVVDWSRKSSAFASENIGETEQLDSATNHARALSEVQEAVAEDLQAGGSSSSGSSTSSSESTASSGSSGLLTSLVSSGSGSETSQSATTSAQAESSSWSVGNRSVMGSLTQSVNDRTEQHSSAVRNRRATAVREVSQSEHESVSTRIVANYNHMHALNIQYYEVVQIYRAEARLHRADRCLFIPMQPLEFGGERGLGVIDRFRGALTRAALNGRIRSLLEDDTTAVEIVPARPVHFPGIRPDLADGVLASPTLRRAATVSASPPRAASGAPGTVEPAGPGAAPPLPDPPPIPRIRLWDTDAVARLARFIDRSPVRPRSDSLFVPDDTELIGISFDQVSVKTVRIDQVGSTAAEGLTSTVPPDVGRVDLGPGIRLVELDAIHVTKAGAPAAEGTMTFHCAYLGRRFALPAIPLELATGTAPQRVVSFRNDQADRRRELQQHLNGQRAHYSRAVFRSLDAATLTFILGRFRFGGRPLIDQVEPRPVTIAGNYLVLRAPVEEDEASGVAVGGEAVTWSELLERRGLDGSRLDRRLVPIPTGGVFAEAVLGRSNAAEKLDITRFWNWQDSPIPLSPTDIAPVQTGSRATAEDLIPGSLSPPLLNIVQPTALPDPTGMSAVLNALAALNFRDMSGLAGTQALAKAGQEATLDAASAAGKLASENLKTEAQKAVQMGQIAADIAKSAISANAAKAQAKTAGSATGVGGISRDGALVNEARKLDQSGATTRGQGASPSEGTGGAGAGGTPGAPANALEVDAFKSALFGPLGASGLDAASVILAKTAGAGSNTGSGAGSGGGTPLVSPFRGPLGDPLTTDAKLTQAFSDAVAAVASDPTFTGIAGLPRIEDLPIAIVALNEDAARTRPHVGQHLDAMHYSGSMPKFAAMVGAYQLRAAVDELAATLGDITEDEFFQRVAATFDPQIRSAVPRIRDSIGRIEETIGGVTVSEDLRLPKYRRIFKATKASGRFTVDFRVDSTNPDQDFFGHLRAMIVESDNVRSGHTIRTLGYGVINGALAKAGFFDGRSGIWLCGDYNRAPVLTIASVNDGQVKQVTSCLATVRLFTLLHDHELIAPAAGGGTGTTDAHDEMLALLRAAVTSSHAPSLLDRALPSPAPFEVLQSKIGVGTLKDLPGKPKSSCLTDAAGNTNRCVLSEISIVRQTASPRRKFVVCWQNVVDANNRGLADVRRVVDLVAGTMDRYAP